jgi:hypothetical protein
MDADAWLEINGAFAGPDGRYQREDHRDRALRLRTRGE